MRGEKSCKDSIWSQIRLLRGFGLKIIRLNKIDVKYLAHWLPPELLVVSETRMLG